MFELMEITGQSAVIKVIGIGGGGGKLAKAFLDLGFNKTILINTTEKDEVDEKEVYSKFTDFKI